MKNLTPQEREARAELTLLTTFNLKRAANALDLARAANGRQGYAIARAWAEQAGIYILDMRGNAGSLSDRLAALRNRITRTIEGIYPNATKAPPTPRYEEFCRLIEEKS